MGARLRYALNGLLAGLFALAMVAAPTEHARAVLERAAFAVAYAMPDGTLPELCSDHGEPADGHGQHLFAPACLACVIMAAPGLADRPSVTLNRAETPGRADLRIDDVTHRRQHAWALSHARAPPAVSIA